MPETSRTDSVLAELRNSCAANAVLLEPLLKGAFNALPERVKETSELKELPEHGGWNVILRTRAHEHCAIIGVYPSSLPSDLGIVVVVDKHGAVRAQVRMTYNGGHAGDTLAFLLLSCVRVLK